MDERAEWVYLVEILAQYRSSRRAASRMNDDIVAFQRANDATARERIAELFDDAADFLQHAANVSKMLWPPPGAKESALARGRHLQASLGLSPGQALADRRLRNHLEHYDERLDLWAEAEHNSRRIVDGFFGPRSSIKDADDSDIMRLYDPSRRTYIFRGESFDLQAIEAALDDVARRAEERLKNDAPDLFAHLRSARLI